MTISYTEMAKLALLDTGSSNWGAVFNAALTQFDQGIILSFDAGENLLEFDAVYISAEDEVKKADGDDATKRPCIGIALADTDSGDSVKVLVIGWADYDDTALAALAASGGDNLYLSATAGQLTTSPVIVHPQVIAQAITDTTANITRIFILAGMQVGEIIQQAHIEDVPELSEANEIDNADAINEILAALEAVGILASS